MEFDLIEEGSSIHMVDRERFVQVNSAKWNELDDLEFVIGPRPSQTILELRWPISGSTRNAE